MFTKIESWLSLGNRHVVATAFYLGLAVLLVGITLLDFPDASASGSASCSYTKYVNQEGILVLVTYSGCPDGQQCCDGVCIPSDYICCEDGTYGDADSCMCLCCDDCGPDSLTTLVCD